MGSDKPLRETAKARQAWNDYLAMGADRSLPKLAERYKSGIKPVPTRQLSRLLRWSSIFGWQKRLADIADQERNAIIQQGIANKQNRIDALNRRWGLIEQVMAERAQDAAVQGAPGGRTGLVVHQLKIIGTGRNAQMIDHFEVDHGLLKEIRAHEEQAAKELGQWVEKREDNGNQKVVVEYVNNWRDHEGDVAGAAPGATDSPGAGEAAQLA